MKVPLRWLNDYVDLHDLTPGQVAERLTFSGVEVEGIEPVGHDYAGLVVGEVRSVRAHANADRLRLCEVFDGETTRTVVCGAHNFGVGDKAAFAPVGAVLPDGTVLRKAKIRGEVSHGMLLAEDELGLSDDHAGILLFDRGLAPGTPLGDCLPGPDVVLDLEITWNRPDCLSLIGIARELAALLKRPLKVPEARLDEQGPPIEKAVGGVTVEDSAGCPRYTARVLADVRNGPAPLWMRQRLMYAGVRSISALVDVTNYVMLECGQPLHAFDLNKLSGRQIIVRRARPGECLETLDGEQRRLSPAMLVIADADKAVAVAGVMGGAASEVDGTTRAVLLESASFDAPGVKQTAYALGMHTESAHRFERGVDLERAEWASRRASGLMADLTGGRVTRGVVDVRVAPSPPRTVTLRFDRARQVAGFDLSGEAMTVILEGLGLECLAQDGEQCRMRIPGFRPDLAIEADLIEEVVRMHGLDAVPRIAPAAPVISEIDDAGYRMEQRCRELLLGLGFTEALHYSFTASNTLDGWDERDAASRVQLPNPVSADYAVMRPSLLPQLVESLGRNHARQVPALALFEIGRVFRRDDDGKAVESTHLAMGLYGPAGRDGLDRRRPVDPEEAFFWLKGALEALFRSLGCPQPVFTAEAEHPAFRPGYAARLVLGDQAIGVIGLVDAKRLHRYRLHAPMAVVEVALAPVLSPRPTASTLRPPPAFPAVVRDIALIVGAGINHAQIVALMHRNAPKELTSVALFDSFKSDEIGTGKRCLGYSLEYRSDTRTLTDEEVNQLYQPVVAALRSEPDIEIRDR